MIDSLSQLAEHCRRVAGRFPRLASRVRLEPSTVTEEDLSRLSVLWGKVPESYRQCIVSFNLAGVAVGYFELAPPMQQGETLVDALIRTKAERLAMEVPAALRLVGAYEGDPLLLDLRDEGAEGQVLRLDLGAGPRPQLTASRSRSSSCWLRLAGWTRWSLKALTAGCQSRTSSSHLRASTSTKSRCATGGSSQRPPWWADEYDRPPAEGAIRTCCRHRDLCRCTYDGPQRSHLHLRRVGHRARSRSRGQRCRGQSGAAQERAGGVRFAIRRGSRHVYDLAPLIHRHRGRCRLPSADRRSRRRVVNPVRRSASTR